jgi:hypothetical protein
MNAALMARRKRKNTRCSFHEMDTEMSSFAETVPDTQPNPELAYSRSESYEILEVHLKELNPRLRETGTATATNANPIVMLIMRLLAAASVTNDRIDFTHRASPQNNLGAARGPIRFELVRRCGKWDKQNRTLWSSAPALTCQDLSRKRGSFLLKQKIQLKENNPPRLQLLKV